jgi:hypothetical protein
MNQPLQTTAAAAATITTAIEQVAGDGAFKALHRVFLERGVRGILSLTMNMDSGAIEAAVAESSDLGTLLSAMESTSGMKILTGEDPLAAARMRGLRMKLKLLEKAGGAMRPNEVAGLLRMSRQAVGKRRREGRLLGLETGRRGYEYPACQFGDGGTIGGLAQVLAAFAEDVDPWTRLAFLLNPNDALGGEVPLDLMWRGEVEPVVRLAAIVGEHGAV